ncbi:peptidoglycan DD-metalloendopeptidase family protein [Marinobacter sp.]|uniref:peptidoglycan DD-metalloendopeptidase family protein n=1 Tax=Marinobacter sp. TaxID=50741 RepID=UPI0034A03D04
MGCIVRGLSLPVILALLLSGCNTAAIYQDDRYNPPVFWGRHVVKSGETLISIAWRYGRDYRELGNANGISPPYKIRVGQVLRLDLRGKVVAGSDSRSTPTPTARTSAPPSRTSAPPRSQPAPRVERAPISSAPLPDQTQKVSGIDWRWPHVGTVLAGFSTSGKVNKGVDINGNAGDPVRAAASGNVVYAGSGLLGYGNLIIVNHNEHYLSAYAHARKILVKEGDSVQAGETIAELGSSGTDRNKLHFEIRKNGNPVNPLPYLPSRK